MNDMESYLKMLQVDRPPNTKLSNGVHIQMRPEITSEPLATGALPDTKPNVIIEYADKPLPETEYNVIMRRIQMMNHGNIEQKDAVAPVISSLPTPIEFVSDNEGAIAAAATAAATAAAANDEQNSKPQPKIIKKPKLKRTQEKVEIDHVTEEGVEKKGKKGKKKQKDETVILEEPDALSPVDVHESGNVSDTNEEIMAPKKLVVKTNPYYMNNRKVFVQKMAEIFRQYKARYNNSNETISCDRSSDQEGLFLHQELLLDYLNSNTPYRGLLLYHGLGSGKTCASIAIAEGMKYEGKKIVVMTPASLTQNYRTEIKKCGDPLYKKLKSWKFVKASTESEIAKLAKELSLPNEYVVKTGGAWVIDESNSSDRQFNVLSATEQKKIDQQLDKMIESKYHIYHYNGESMSAYNTLTNHDKKNPFDNAVVIVDEAHNLVRRIANKLPKNGQKVGKNQKANKDNISVKLYRYLMDAVDTRIVLLTGTPIINYPNEIGVLFNILRGFIKTWVFTLNIQTDDKIDRDYFLELFAKNDFKTYDYVSYSGNILTITRNPFGFINKLTRSYTKSDKEKETQKDHKKPKDGTKKAIVIKRPGTKKAHQTGGSNEFKRYQGVVLDETGNLSDADFEHTVISILERNRIRVSKTEIRKEKCLPDESETFLQRFIDIPNGVVLNPGIIQKRILGLTSYFRSAQEELLPQFELAEDGSNYHVVNCEMSPFQFAEYDKIREQEYQSEINKAKVRALKQKKENIFEISSSYRTFSRAACNFIFPNDVKRPYPDKGLGDLDEYEGDDDDDDDTAEGKSYVSDDSEDKSKTYQERIADALTKLNDDRYLAREHISDYSPKFAHIIDNLKETDNAGLHLVYSNYREIEGIEILRLALLKNGFAQFKIHRPKGSRNWEILENDEDKDKLKFVLYTGSEKEEERELIRNIYNSSWDLIPSNLKSKLIARYGEDKNKYGSVIKILMITASGAEGINLRNTRYVHIVEPYWHMERSEQVIGRARRICSHQDLPEPLRTVKVFFYMAAFSEIQKTDDKYKQLRLRDVSRSDGKTPVTTDQTLYELAKYKQLINKKMLDIVKSTAIDCQIYAKGNESYTCYNVGRVSATNPNNFLSEPIFDDDVNDDLQTEQVERIVYDLQYNGIKYLTNKEKTEIYDYDIYQTTKTLSQVGRIIRENGKYKVILDK
jgi:Type III restriction enzyme, res subunit/Helicase conserved C-terminal domain